MAEAVVSVALETFRDLLLEEGRLLSGVGDQVKALQTQLKEMQSLLKDADGKQHESVSVRDWIVQITDLAYRAEDVIETYAVEVSSKRGGGLKNLLRRFSGIMKEFHSLHQLGSEISQIKSDLAGVSKSMQDYGIRSIIQGESSGSSANDDNRQWKRQTFPDFQIQDCFVGKDDELKRIISLLVDDDDDQHRILSIWGMGGLGKTTIARKAYNHADTKRHFQSFAWVCITQQCQIRSVLEEVLRQLNPSKREAMSNRELIEELCQIQRDKRCIVVLDDLWETDHWEGLKHAFVVEGLKSKILVTTRKQKVAEIGFPIQLGLLSMESGWELLRKKAFRHTNITDPDIAFDGNLVRKVGKEMVQKCGFLPLTISLLGGVLSKRKSIREWELVKQNMNAYLYRGDGIENENENEIEAVLNLSYEDLPYYLKSCFLYLGLLFKEDRSVHANYIYNTWIAQGMLSRGNREDESLVVTAELYLSELASRSIIQVEVQLDENFKSGKRYSWCKLHDVVRELCLCVAKREGFGVQRLVYEGGKLMHGYLQSNVKTRHLAIYFEGENEAQLQVHGVDEHTCKNLRSLLLENGNKEILEFPDIAIDLQIFKLLRVLKFRRLKFKKRKVPKGIGNLIHLRYLSFQRCELDEAPSSIRNMSYLQTLDLATSWDVRIPNVFNKLLRLKHLMLPLYSDGRVGDFALELDEGLDELETLRGFDSSMHRLESITRLKNLESFQATIRDNESLSLVIDVVTKQWKKLRYCSLYIDQDCNFTSTEEGLMVLQKLLACPNIIHELSIYVKIGQQLGECRNHVSSSQIVELSLIFCEIEDDPMEILGKLPVLRKLDLWIDSFVGEEMTCPAFSFPRLKELEVQNLANLREWRVEEGAMPLLSKIRIEECPDLRMLPDGLRFISALEELRITKMPGLGKRVLASEEDGGEGEGEDFDKVRHVPSIIVNN